MRTTVDGMAAETQKAKLLMMFCALGLAAFLLDLAAGIWLWQYMKGYAANLPRLDVFLSDLRVAGPQGLADTAASMHAGWAACEEARGGTIETVVHMAMAASFIGLALFSLCFLLAFLLHQGLLRRPGGQPAPLPPDDVDGTWR